MKLSLVAVAAVALVACAPEAEDDWSSDESNNTAADKVETAKRLAPIALKSDGVLPPGEAARRGGFVQGFYGGKDDHGRACSLHVIHYQYERLQEVYIHAWKDADAKGAARYDDDLDHNTSGVERRDVIEYGAIHHASISTLRSDGEYRIEPKACSSRSDRS